MGPLFLIKEKIFIASISNCKKLAIRNFRCYDLICHRLGIMDDLAILLLRYAMGDV